MSKFPEYKHEKSQEWFNRALNAIPSGCLLYTSDAADEL